MFRRHHVLAVAAASLAIASVSMTGCSSDTKATPRMTFISQVSPGSHPSSECPETGTWFSVGDFGAPSSGIAVRPVDSGSSEQQGTASLTCSVKASGGGFQVAGLLTLTGATGGSFSVTGLFNPSGDQSNISVSLTRQGSTYKQNDCVATYPDPNQTVAAGRVWATVSCPNADNASAQRTCEALATFRFENCDQ
jgi:hypothetical protein